MMLFSLKHLLLPALGALALLQCTVARPVANDGLIERRETYENALLDRDFINLELEARTNLVDDSLLERASLDRRAGQTHPRQSTEIKKEVKANPYSKGKAKTDTASAAPRPKNKQKALPNSAKLTLSKDARKELDGMGLHGKARKSAIKWHKNQLKQQMKTNPVLKGKATTGVIEHVAHKGGSDPKEKNHITASFRDKNRMDVANEFNGGKNHHLYVDNKGLPPQAKAASDKNNAEIKGQSKSHQTSVGRTRSPGKSSNKGKGKQNPENAFSKNAEKGFQEKQRR